MQTNDEQTLTGTVQAIGIHCVNCKWFRSCNVDDTNPEYQWGRCHRNPPQLPGFQIDGCCADTGFWPTVEFTDFCGEFTTA